MTGLGTLVNMAAILIGSGIGLLLKNGIPKRLQTTISSAVGLCVVFVGVTGAIKGLMNVSGTTFETKDTLVVVICMAIGAAFSMFPVGIYQGSITLLAGLVKPYLTDLMIGRLSCIGSILIFALGLNLTIGTKIKIANMLPAVFLPVIVCLLGF